MVVQERLPESFKVKGKGLANLTTLRGEIQTAIQEEQRAAEVHDKARVARNQMIKEFSDFRVDYRRAVALEFGTGSPEYESIPWNEPESHPEKKPDQPQKREVFPTASCDVTWKVKTSSVTDHV